MSNDFFKCFMCGLLCFWFGMFWGIYTHENREEKENAGKETCIICQEQHKVHKATQEHDAAYLMNKKQKDIEAENKRLRFLITEIREFLIGGAIPGHVHLKQEYIREIYTIASKEDEKRRNEK